MTACFKCSSLCETTDWVEIEPGLEAKVCSTCGSKKAKHDKVPTLAALGSACSGSLSFPTAVHTGRTETDLA